MAGTFLALEESYERSTRDPSSSKHSLRRPAPISSRNGGFIRISDEVGHKDGKKACMHIILGATA
jgi:hypothetical protein